VSSELLTTVLAGVGVLSSALMAFLQFGIFDKMKELTSGQQQSNSSIANHNTEVALLKRDIEDMRAQFASITKTGPGVSKEDWHSLILSMTESAHKVEKHYLELKFAVSDLIETSEKEKDFVRMLNKNIESVEKELGNLKLEIETFKKTVGEA